MGGWIQPPLSQPPLPAPPGPPSRGTRTGGGRRYALLCNGEGGGGSRLSLHRTASGRPSDGTSQHALRCPLEAHANRRRWNLSHHCHRTDSTSPGSGRHRHTPPPRSSATRLPISTRLARAPCQSDEREIIETLELINKPRPGRCTSPPLPPSLRNYRLRQGGGGEGKRGSRSKRERER